MSKLVKGVRWLIGAACVACFIYQVAPHTWSIDWTAWYMYVLYWAASSGFMFGMVIEIDKQVHLTSGTEGGRSNWWWIFLISLGSFVSVVFLIFTVTGATLAEWRGNKDPEVLAARLKRSKQDA